MEKKSAILTKVICYQAFEIARPSIEALLTAVPAACRAVHIVIPDLNGEPLAEIDFGPDVETQEYAVRVNKVTEISHSKAEIHHRTGRPSLEVQKRAPHLVMVGETVYGGSSDHEGLIAAASGVQAYIDETCSGIVSSIAWGLCMHANETFHAQAEHGHMFEETI